MLNFTCFYLEKKLASSQCDTMPGLKFTLGKQIIYSENKHKKFVYLIVVSQAS